MADIHVLEAGGAAVRCVFHFDVPNVDNEIGVSIRAALVASGIGGTTSMAVGEGPGQISEAEKTAIEAGEVFEYPYSMRKDKAQWDDRSPAERLKVVRHFYGQQNADLSAQIVARLAYYGYVAAKE